MYTAVERAASIAKQADVIAALTLEVLKGTTSAFDSGKILMHGGAGLRAASRRGSGVPPLSNKLI